MQMNLLQHAICAAAVGLATLAAAQAPGPDVQKTKISLGTATPGGGFPLYGGAVADVVNATDPSLLIEPRNTKGSAENIPLLEAGSLDLALVAGEPAYEALMGVGRPRTPLKIVAAMYSTPGMFAVRGDSPYRSIRDLVGKPVAFGARGSGLVILSRYVLDGIGLDQDKDFQAIYLDRAGDGPAMVLDGRAAALWGGGIGWPGFTAVAQAGARFIAPDAEEAGRISAGAGAPPRRGRARPEARPGARDDGGQHRRRRAERRSDPPGRGALSARDRRDEIAGPMQL